MYRGKNSDTMPSLNNSMSALGRSSIAESQTENLQKQVDNYTRKLEQEKRRFFRVQENHRQILKDFNSKVNELESFKTKKFETEMSKLTVKSLTLENTLDKAISTYNQVLSKNNSMKLEINELRKDKKSSAEIFRSLQERVEQLKQDIQQKKDEISEKEEHITQVKQRIIQIKIENEEETTEYQGEIDNIQNKFESSRIGDKTRFIENGTKNETVDNQPIVRLRLKNLLQMNKEKIRVIEQYKKTMTIIENAFEQMQQKSGINDLEELTKTIIKQEEQQTSIYNYIDKLNKSIESVKDSNAELKRKIQSQEEINENHRRILSGTPEAEKRRKEQLQIIHEKQVCVNQLESFLQSIQPQLFSVLRQFGLAEGNTDKEALNCQNVESYLSMFEECIQGYLPQSGINTDVRESINEQFNGEITTYSRAPPTVVFDQLKEKLEEKLIDSEKLKEYASDYWEKRKDMGKNLRA